ncbi:hypothetical protein Tco_0995591, partial [Tanacetum coccineum]
MRCGSGLSKGLCLICASRYGNNPNPNSLNDSPNIFKNVSQSPPIIDHHCCYGCGDSLDGIFCQQCTCESCGNGARYGYNCPPKVSIISNPEPCNNQTVDELPQTFPSYDLTCYSGDGSSFTYDSTPNFVYDSPNVINPPPQPSQYTVNHPIFNAQNKLLNSQNELMEQMTSIGDMVGQYMQKKDEEKRIAEEQAAKARYWKIPICYDDDDEEESSIPLGDIIISGLPPCVAITPVLSTEEPVDSLIMEDEHLDTIPATESDKVIKSSVENLVQIPSESEGIPDNMCDVPFCDNSPPLDISKDQFEDFSDSNDDSTSIDDDSFSIDDIEYVEASPPDSELVSLEVVEIVILEVGGIDTDILLTIKDDILREKLLNVNLLITKIEVLKDNPIPSSDFVTKYSSTSLNLFLEETNNFDNSLPESETFCFNLEEISSGSPTSYSDLSLPDYEAFFCSDPDSGNFTMDVASPPDSELVSLEVVEIVILEVGGIDIDILLTIKKYILLKKLLNVNLLIAKIEALKDNPTPSSDFVTKSSSTSPNFFLEETNTFDNSLPESQISSGSPTSYLDLSLPDYEAFFCDSEPDSGNFTMDVVEDIFDNPTREPRVHVLMFYPPIPPFNWIWISLFL